MPYYVSPTELVKFVNYSTTSYQIINEDDDINKGLLELLETIESSVQNRENLMDAPIGTILSSRRKRSVKDVDSKTEIINLELQFLEGLVESKNEATSVDGMKRLVEKVKTIVTRLCNDSSFTYGKFGELFFFFTLVLLHAFIDLTTLYYSEANRLRLNQKSFTVALFLRLIYSKIVYIRFMHTALWFISKESFFKQTFEQ